MKNKLTTITVLLLTCSSLFAQSNKSRNITGTVQDESHKPVEAANVSLVRLPDSSIVRSLGSDKKGNFGFYNVTYGKYMIRITAVGNAPFYSSGFEIGRDNMLKELGPIVLKPETKDLKTISVVGVKPYIEQKADRIVVNVDASPS